MDIRPLSGKLQKKAEEEINEIPSRLNDDLTHIEQWLLKQPHLTVRKDRQWLLAFLRSCKFSLEKTKEKLDYFYTVKSITPEYFTNKDPMLPELQEILKAGAYIPIRKTTEAAGFPTILLVKWKNADPNKITFTTFFKLVLMSADVLLKENDNFTINGAYVVQDMADFPLGFITHLTPALCKKAAISITKAYPTRIKGIYFMNTPSIYETFVNMFTPFMSTKIKERVKIFGKDSFDKLTEEIPLSLFPKEYGGESQPCQELAAEWRKILEDNRNWFLEDAQYCSNEAKRPGKPKTSTDIFGIEGSFRTLNMD